MRLPQLLAARRGKNLFLPAHGRGNGLSMGIRRLLRNKPGVWDLPELPEIGSPTCSIGAVGKSQCEAAEAFGARKCWYGVNGATGLLQSAVLAIAKPQQAILMPRNVHRSIIQACILGDISPVLFDLPFLEDRGHFFPPSLAWFRKVLKKLKEERIVIAAVVLTNPTYQGYSEEIEPLIKAIHKLRLPVLVDEAHGTYFASSLGDIDLPKSALNAGADLVVHSLHKSAPGLVQSASLWLQGDLIDPDVIDRSISLLQTTSPSALLMASCESALHDLCSTEGRRDLKNKIDSAKDISFQLRQKGLPLLENQDPLKFILHTSSVGISGIAADHWLMNRGIIAELPEPGTLTFCLGFAKHKGLVNLLKLTWENILSSNLERNCLPPFTRPPSALIKTLNTSLLLAFKADSEIIPLSSAVGRISSELISPYPPGIAILLPGEKLNSDLVSWMIGQRYYWPEQIPSNIKVVL